MTRQLTFETAVKAKEPAPKVARKAGQKLRLLDMVRVTMEDGTWMPSHAVQADVHDTFGTYASDSSITARIRELRRCGYTVESRRVPGRNYSEYRLRDGGE